MIEPLNHHYAMESIASIYDEEAMTALELAGRTTAKVNECVEAVNNIPDTIAQDVQKHIDNGDFDKQVNIMAGDLKKQVSESESKLRGEIDDVEEKVDSEMNAIESRIIESLNTINNRISTFTRLGEGSTSGDAELQDIRNWANGVGVSASAGDAVRNQFKQYQREAYQGVTNFGYSNWHAPFEFEIEKFVDGTHYLQVTFNTNPAVYFRGAGVYHAKFNATTCADIMNNITIIDETHAVLLMPVYSSLVFNWTDKLYHLRVPAPNMQSEDVCLIKSGYAYPVGGTLFDQWCIQKTDNNTKRLTALEQSNSVLTHDAKAQAFSSLFTNGTVEKFLFFTDPHLSEGTDWELNFKNYMNRLKDVYNVAPVDFAICGGDWLGNGDTQAEACYKLGVIDSQMRDTFHGKYYHVLGNHDTNYQGKVNADSESNTGRLHNDVIRNLWFNDKGHNYYSFMGANTRFFVFDTELDWETEYNDYKTEQVKWFINELLSNNSLNLAIALHMFYVTDSLTVHPMSAELTAISNAFNYRQTYTFNGVTYDFKNCTGKVHFVLGGHLHKDVNTVLNNIPVVLTTNTTDDGTPTFDLCLADYTHHNLHLVRIGTGEDRTVNI